MELGKIAKGVAIAAAAGLVTGLAFGSGSRIGNRVTGRLMTILLGKESLGKIELDMPTEEKKD